MLLITWLTILKHGKTYYQFQVLYTEHYFAKFLEMKSVVIYQVF